MAKILNYEPGETLATGFVKPKVTSLFFDKIWIPQSLLDTTFEYSAVPKEVLIQETEELRISNNQTKHAKTNDNTEKINNTRDDFIGRYSGDVYKISMVSNNPAFRKTLLNPMYISHTMSIDDIDERIKYKFSRYRNNAIMVCSENFSRQYSVYIAPVYLNLTEFEREAQNLDCNQLYENNTTKYKHRQPNTFINQEAFSICIQDFPNINEDELSWEHVMDIRKDKKRMRQLQRFTNWTNRKLKGKSPDEIREILESELDEYRAAIKELGIKTFIGSFSTLISAVNPMVSLFSNPQSIMPWISMVTIPLPFAADIYFANMKNRKNPIAYLYDIQNKY